MVNEDLIKEMDKFQEEFEIIVDKYNSNSFKDNVPEENKKRMYAFINSLNNTRMELDKFRDSLFDDDYGNNLKTKD